MPYREIDATALGVLLRSSREIAVLDLRPAQEFGNGAPLHGANVPAAELSSRVRELVPNRHTPIALLDADGGLIAQSASELLELGYTNVQGLAGGLNGNERLPVVPIRIAGPRVISGEVERSFRTPVTTAGELAALRRNGASVIVLDTRSVAEYEREHIPGSFPTPGGEILPRFNALVDSPETHVIVTCAGRSRAVLGAQSLILAGVVNPVSTLDFGTLGWVDAGYPLNHGPEQPLQAIRSVDLDFARRALASFAESAPAIDADELQTWLADASRTTYALDVRLPEDYERANLPGSVSAPAGQLGISLGKWVAVQGGRLVLIDADPGVRALTVGRWFARIGWEVSILKHDFVN